MKTSLHQPPNVAVIFSANNKYKQRTTRRQQKHDLLLTFMARLHEPPPVPVKKKSKNAFLRSLLSVFF